MSSHVVTIQPHRSGVWQDENVIVLGEKHIRKFKVPTHGMITLRFGSAKRSVKVVPLSKSSGLRLGESMLRGLGLHHGSVLRLSYRPATGVLSIGPLICVLLDGARTEVSDRLFGPVTLWCRELIEAGKKLGAFIYFVTPNDLENVKQTVPGWTYANGWRKSVFPLPDVVHNRLTRRLLENKQSVQHFFKEVKSRNNATVFNEKFLNKTEVFQALKNDATLHRVLPESHALKQYSQLKSMCARYPVVFLKPARGSLGRGIIRVAKQLGGGYVCSFANVNGSKIERFKSLSSVYSVISGKMKSTSFLIQQGLNLIRVNDRPVDFRALVQKNERGEWAITSIVARIAASRRFVSNLASGGSLSTVKEALGKSNLSASASREKTSAMLRSAAIDIAKGIETNIPHHFGELGIDLAVDSGGRVWLIEVNSKPSKNDKTPLGEGKIRPSAIQLIKYSRYLSDFSR